MNGPRATTGKLQPATSRWLLSLCLLSLSLFIGHRLCTLPAKARSPNPPPRVNIPHFSDQVDWGQTAIFWFGKNEQGVPSRNYADVRAAYIPEALRIRVTVIDYYLWYKENPTAADDLTQYDAVAIYLDTDFDQAATPQTDDYTFLIGAHHWPNENATRYHRQARGTGMGWDTTWTGDWTDYEALSWSCNPGPNSNECGIDYGWTAIFTIPWETLGRSGPPSEGTLWGLGVLLHDRDDQPPAGYVAPEPWPETFDADNPATWGELHFGYADYEPPPAVSQGTTMIRAALPEDNTVEDAWLGGGGTCGGGHNGGSETNHGDSKDLFVGTEIKPTHFPCFNKSFLRFSLDAIPSDKTIISASMTLHVWSHAGETPDLAQPSWVHLFTISDPWEEMTIHWNNAPLAQENISAIWVNPYSGDRSNPDWPGDPYTWDATQAVAEAYAQDRPLSVAIYGSDGSEHSTKYLTSSETGLGDSHPNWNEQGRPTLNIVWGLPQTEIDKQVWPVTITRDDVVTYTLSWLGTGQPLTMTDTLPDGLSAPDPISVSSGEVNCDSVARRVVCTGTPAGGQAVTVTYPATVQVDGPLALRNTAVLTANGELASSDTALIIVDGYSLYLPLVRKNEIYSNRK
jgi:hypothetical protein